MRAQDFADELAESWINGNLSQVKLQLTEQMLQEDAVAVAICISVDHPQVGHELARLFRDVNVYSMER